MQPARTLLLLAALAALAAALPRAPRAPAAAPALARTRRQLADDDKLQPLDVEEGEEQTREKRKLEGVTQAGFGIKNAILGFVFGKINSLIDAKTRLIDTLDKQNIEKNKQYGIEAPQNGLASLGGVVSQVVGPKLQLLGPKIQAVSGLFGGSSGGGADWHYISSPRGGHGKGGHHGKEGHHGGKGVHKEPTRVLHGGFSYEASSPHPERAPRGRPAGPAPRQAAPPGAHHGRWHPGVRPEQGQPGLPGEPVWAIRVASHQDN